LKVIRENAHICDRAGIDAVIPREGVERDLIRREAYWLAVIPREGVERRRITMWVRLWRPWDLLV